MMKKTFFLGIFTIAVGSGVLFAQNNSFLLSTNRLQPYFPTYIGNGYFSIVSSQLGTKPTESYVESVFDNAEGDIARIASIPAWNEINFFDGEHWLNDANIQQMTIASFRQTLDMYDGILSTQYEWKDGKKSARIATETFVSRANKNIAAVKLTITPGFSGRVRISFPITAWNEPKRMRLAEIKNIHVQMVNGVPDVWYPGFMKPIAVQNDVGKKNFHIEMISKAEGRGTEVAEAIEAHWSSNVKILSMDTTLKKNNPSAEILFDASKGKTYTFYKFAAVASSYDDSLFKNKANVQATTAGEKGYKALRKENADAWHKLWKTDIVIEGNPQLQQVVHSMMFYLLCSIRAGTDFGIPPMGLSSCGYYGHIFWDSDTWMFPSLLVMHPDIAKSMVMFRYKALPAAEANAKLNGYNGAMYPWESDEKGNEACPKFAYQNALYENHVTGDVAFAQWQYFLITNDTVWLKNYGYPVIKETAEYWTTRATRDSTKDRYNINHVVSVDEGLIGVNNDAYTNLVAKRNLQIAAQAASLLKEPVNPLWNDVAGKLYIPYDSTQHCYLTYENAPPKSLGAVVPLLYYPLELDVPNDIKKNDLTNALNYTIKVGGWNGVMMGIALYQNVAAEIGDRKLFNEFFKLSYKEYLRPPFNVLAETPKNNSINFLTGAGGFLQQVIFGYTGLRIGNEGLVKKFNPMLPPRVKKVELKNFYSRGKRYTIIVEGETVQLQKMK